MEEIKNIIFDNEDIIGKVKDIRELFINNLANDLSDKEIEMVTDHIISTYYPFDTNTLMSFYNSYHDMINAMRSSAGNEYDIKEKYYLGTDAVYGEMANIVENTLNIKPVRRITTFNLDDKFAIAKLLQKSTMASTLQISKFLHMKIPNTGEA